MGLSIAATSRLKSKKKIGLLFEQGKRLNSGSLHLRYLSIDKDQSSEFGVSVPKKKHPLAVNRNRIKRLLREALRAQEHEWLQQGKLLMFIYLGTKLPELQKLEAQMNQLLKQLHDETS